MRKAPSIRNKILLLILCSMAGIGKVRSQIGVTSYFYKAEKLYQGGRYFEAAQVFEKYIASERPSKSSGSPFAIEKKVKDMPTLNMHEQAVYSLAESYRNYNDYARAEKYYKLATEFKDNAYNLSWFWYGISLRADNKFAEAYEALSTFTTTYKTLGPVLLKADREMESLKFIRQQLQRKDSAYSVRQLLIHDSIAAYALATIKEDTVAFTSIHADSSDRKGVPIDYDIRLYQSVLNDSPLDLDHPIPIPDSPKVQNGLACFTADGRTMFLTRWTQESKKKHSAIYRSVETDTGWSAPVAVEGAVNFPGYNSTQPFITDDAKYLLFASDRPGGEGGYDIWYVQFDSTGRAFDPTNLGNMINTPGDDETPYYHRKSETLVFSSNGRTGMGGFDIYYSKRGFDFLDWGAPKNPGIPINSTKDDQYFISTDDINLWNSGWVSSDRSTGCCLALFSVQQNNSLVLTGSVLDSVTHQPVGNAEVTVTDPRHIGKVIAVEHSDSLGVYHVQTKNISSFHLDGQKPGYRPDSNDVDVTLEAGPNSFNAPNLYLAKMLTKKQLVRQQVTALSSSNTLANFEFSKHGLKESAYPNLDSLATLLRQVPDMIVEIGGYTDGKGSIALNIRLAQARVDACMEYLLKKGIPAAQLKTKAYGPCCPVAPETIDGKDNPDGRARNRRVEYKLLN